MATPRRLSGWLEAFQEYTDHLPTSEIFRQWTGIAILAGAMERKVWVYTFGMDLYPNLYTILVAPPGVGKTVATSLAQTMWGDLPDHHLAPSAMSRASLMDAVRAAERRIIRHELTPSAVEFNSLLIPINELSTLINVYDNDFMGTLTDIYDGKRYGEKKRGKDLNYTLLAPQINLLAATSPSYLSSVMPEGAWDQGFASRMIMIYSGETPLRDLFIEEEKKTRPYQDLLHDLKIIGGLFGKMGWDEEAQDAMSEWYMGRNKPEPEHPKLLHYNKRRTTHCLKLCMVSAVSRSDKLMVTLYDFKRALKWLEDAEALMPSIFLEMSSGGQSKIIHDCWYYCADIYKREKKPLSEARIWNHLQQQVPAYSIPSIITALVNSGLLTKQFGGEYVPLMKQK